MLDMFLYNWQIREDWFDFCKNISEENLTKKRVGGFGSFLHNLFHVIDCEQIWINQLKGTQVLVKDFNSISNLEEVIEISNTTKSQTLNYLQSYNSDIEKRVLEVKSKNGKTYHFPYEKVLQHIITHEVHHIGQLSVWAREIGKKPISSDLLFRQI